MRKVDSRSARAREKLIAAMRDAGKTLTYHEACDLLCISKDCRNGHMKRLHAERLIHIDHYRIIPECQPVAVFAWGDMPDAERPPRKNRKEIIRENSRRRRERVGKEAWSAIRAAQYQGASVLVVAGKTVWRKGQINIEAARAAFA